MGLRINLWTQSIDIGNNVRLGLEHEDVFLLDEHGNPYAVLVNIKRYEEMKG
jgi:hypothetical protein